MHLTHWRYHFVSSTPVPTFDKMIRALSGRRRVHRQKAHHMAFALVGFCTLPRLCSSSTHSSGEGTTVRMLICPPGAALSLITPDTRSSTFWVWPCLCSRCIVEGLTNPQQVCLARGPDATKEYSHTERASRLLREDRSAFARWPRSSLHSSRCALKRQIHVLHEVLAERWDSGFQVLYIVRLQAQSTLAPWL